MTGRKIAAFAAGLALLICFGVPFLRLFDVVTFRTYLVVFNLGSVLWFVAAPVAYGVWKKAR